LARALTGHSPKGRPAPWFAERRLRPGPAGAGAAALGAAPCSAHDGLVDQLPQLRPDGVDAGGEQLGHEHAGDLLHRIDPERGAGHAAPAVLAGRAEAAAGQRVVDDGEAQAEAGATVGPVSRLPGAAAYRAASRPASAPSTHHRVWSIPSGSSTRSASTRSSVLPVTTSSTRPSTSVATE